MSAASGFSDGVVAGFSRGEEYDVCLIRKPTVSDPVLTAVFGADDEAGFETDCLGGVVLISGKFEVLQRTVPAGKTQFSVSLKVFCSDEVLWSPSLGRAIHRSFTAVSDHKGVGTPYGMKAGVGVRLGRSMKAPV